MKESQREDCKSLAEDSWAAAYEQLLGGDEHDQAADLHAIAQALTSIAASLLALNTDK